LLGCRDDLKPGCVEQFGAGNPAEELESRLSGFALESRANECLANLIVACAPAGLVCSRLEDTSGFARWNQRTLGMCHSHCWLSSWRPDVRAQPGGEFQFERAPSNWPSERSLNQNEIKPDILTNAHVREFASSLHRPNM
jgi:hypothetical protein